MTARDSAPRSSTDLEKQIAEALALADDSSARHRFASTAPTILRAALSELRSLRKRVVESRITDQESDAIQTALNEIHDLRAEVVSLRERAEALEDRLTTACLSAGREAQRAAEAERVIEAAPNGHTLGHRYYDASWTECDLCMALLALHPTDALAALGDSKEGRHE